MVSKTHDIELQVDTLVGEARATNTRVNNVFNDFLILSNIQFVESVSDSFSSSVSLFVSVFVYFCLSVCLSVHRYVYNIYNIY